MPAAEASQDVFSGYIGQKPKNASTSAAATPTPSATAAATPPSGDVFASYVGGKQPPAPELSEDEAWYKSLPWYKRAIISFNEFFGVPMSVSRRPSEAIEGVSEAIKHPSLEAQSLREMYNSMSRAQQDTIDRAFQLQHSKSLVDKANGFVMGIYATLPVVGPAMVSAADKWDSGDKAGAVGSMAALAAQALAPHAAETGAKVLPNLEEVSRHPVETAKTAGRAIAETGKAAVESARGTAAGALQGMAGTGARMAEKLTTEELTKLRDTNAKALEQYEKETAKFDQNVKEINEDHDHRITNIKEKYASDVAEQQKKIEADRAAREHEIEQARTEWVKEAHEARRQIAGPTENPPAPDAAAPKTEAELQARRNDLEQRQRVYSDQVKQNVSSTYDKVSDDFDARWGNLTKQVGKDRPVKVDGIAKAVEEARAKLGGIPSDLSLFDQVMAQIEKEGENVDTAEGAKPVTKESIPFENARKQYSALGKRAYSMPAGVPQSALLDVLTAYDKAIKGALEDADKTPVITAETTSAPKGPSLVKQYERLKSDYSQFMRDWHDMSSLSTGPSRLRSPQPGSPLARIYRYTDEANIRKGAADAYSDRLLQIYSRYKKFGADPNLLASLRDAVRAEKRLPKKLPAATGLETRVYEGAGKTEGIQVPPRPSEKATAPYKPPEPVEFPGAKLAEEEYRRQTQLAREKRPATLQLQKPPTPENMAETIRQAKLERAKDFAEREQHARWYDFLIGTEVLFQSMHQGLGAMANHAALYLAARLGWRTFIRSAVAEEWMSQITPKDVAMIDKVYRNFPQDRAMAAEAITEAMAERAREGKPIPAPKTFKPLLSASQMSVLLKAAKNAEGTGGGNGKITPPSSQQE